MNIFFYILASILLVGSFYILFYVLRLLDIIRGRREEQVSAFQNKLQPILLLLTLGGGVGWLFSYGSANFKLFHVPVASQQGHLIDDMFWSTTAITLVVFVVTHFLLFLFAFLYRYDKKRWASYSHENNKLEIIWTVIPGIALLLLILNGLGHWRTITSPAPPEAEVIEVVGYQFAWAARYGGKDKKLGTSDYRLIDADNNVGIDFSDKNATDDIMPRKIHIPKGRPVQFKIRALDVIHSFYSPHFRMQMYAIPGMETTFWITPTKTTEEMRIELKNPDFNYEIACNKICGKGHFAMRHIIVVDTPEEYDVWYNAQVPWLEKHPDYVQ